MTDQATPRPAHPDDLPRPTTSFVGRADEVRSVSGLVDGHRLVTVAGPGGAGKTRLAIEVARQAADLFPDGIWWAELAGASDDGAVADAVAEVTGALVDPRRGPLASLQAHLAGRRSLLCLDNAEHVLDGVAAVAEAALRAGREVTVLVTSREPLRLAGEQVWRVRPLDDDAAVDLFVDRGRLVRPSYRPDPDGVAAIRSIVRHLDGIPLALELAAAWLDVLSAEQVLAGLDDRFRLLVRGPRNAQRRQQTLAGSIGWSHALLDDADRALLRRLSVFAGWFPLDAATAVGAESPEAAADVLASLSRLVDKSLVTAEEHGDQMRYRLLETIRTYSAARLVEAKEDHDARNRHLAWCVDLAESADTWHETEPDRWQASLRHEYADLRAALDWGLDGGGSATSARRLAAALAWLWHLDRHGREGVEYLRRAIDVAPDDRSVVQARLLTGLALVIDTAAPLDLEYDAATRALEVATDVGDTQLRGLCLNLAAVGASYTDLDQAWQLADSAAAMAPHDTLVTGAARALQAIIAHHRDRHAEADALFDQVLPVLVGRHRGIAATATGFQAVGALATGDADRARQLATAAVDLAEPLGDYLRVGMARAVLAVVHARTGDLAAADDVLAPVLRLAAEGEVFVSGLPYALGVLAVQRDDPAAATTWFRHGAATTDRGVDTWIAAQSLAELGTVLVATGPVVDAAAVLDRAVTAAARLELPRVLAVARIAQADLAAADPDGRPRALSLAHDALELQVDHGLRAGYPDGLEAVVRHGSAIRPSTADAQILAGADAARAALGLPRTPDQQRRVNTALGRLRAALGDDAVDAAYAEGARLSVDETVAFARRARGTRGRPTTGWPSLTPTELQVTALVSEGLTNPEIATRLLMGRGTVKTHLAHVYTKLGVANRTELATLASSRSVSDGRGSPG